MDQSRSREAFLALWRRALQLPTLADLNPASVREWADQKGLIVGEVVERDVGHFRPTPAIVLRVDGDSACLPKVPATGSEKWQIRRARADLAEAKVMAIRFESVGSASLGNGTSYRQYHAWTEDFGLEPSGPSIPW